MDGLVILLLAVMIFLIVEIASYVSHSHGVHATTAYTIGDASGLFSILLALIAFAATMAVIIPYVISKNMSENIIGAKVEDVFKQQKDETEKKFDDIISDLRWAESHLSRMIGYMLLRTGLDKIPQMKNPANPEDGKLDKLTQYSKDNPLPNPYWAIGWSAKALIRYIRAEETRHGLEAFRKDCINCIMISTVCIECDSNDSNDDNINRIIRAYTDLFDVFQFASNKRGKIVIDEIDDCKNELLGCLKSLNDKSIKLLAEKKSQSEAETEFINKVAAKAKYKEYEHKKISSQEEFIDYYKEWCRCNVDKKRF